MRTLLVLLTVAQAVAPIPPSPASDSLIAGRVIDATTGQAVTGVVVTLLARPTAARPAVPSLANAGVGAVAAEPQRVLVDGSGRFVFPALPAGLYELTATRRGYVTGELGKLRPDGLRQSLNLGERDRRIDLRIRVWKHAALTGEVIDEAGEPVVGVTVQALRRVLTANALRFSTVATAATDDRGRFRIGALPPGDYIVAVPATYTSMPAQVLDGYNPAASGSDPLRIGVTRIAYPPQPLGSPATQRSGDIVLHSHARSVEVPDPPASGPMSVYPATFAPSPPGGAGSEVVTLEAGDAKPIPTIQLRPVAASRLRGLATTPTGPAAFAVLVLTPPLVEGLSSESGFVSAQTVADGDGRFTFLGVPAGTYTLRAIVSQPGTTINAPPPTSPPPPAFWAEQIVTMRAEDSTIQIALRPAFSVAGRVVYEGAKGATQNQLRRDLIALVSADGRSRNFMTGRENTTEPGTFVVADVAGGRYVLRPWILPSGWTLRSMTWRGLDVIDTPIDLTEQVAGIVMTLTDTPSSLSGRVRTASGAADDEASVVVFPADRERWTDAGGAPTRMRAARTALDGTFAISGLPDGDYLVAAIHDSEASAWRSTRVLDTLARSAARVTITGSTAVTQNLMRVDIR